jgi:hypothetical protein
MRLGRKLRDLRGERKEGREKREERRENAKRNEKTFNVAAYILFLQSGPKILH